MGMTASYMEVTEAFIEELKVNSTAETNHLLERLYTDSTKEVCHLDKMWAIFHYFLTGVSVFHILTNCQMENCLLSEAVVGSDGQTEGISWIIPERVKEIADMLATIDEEKQWNDFSMEEFAESDIYMMGQIDVSEADMRQELLDIFKEFKEFYHNVASKRNGVVIMLG